MTIDRVELKKKAMEAASAEEVMEIVRAAGDEITAEEAKQFFDKVQERKTGKALFLDEVEAVSGGGRNALTEGCAATVEAGSYCWFTDFCPDFFTMYDVFTVYGNCTECGAASVYFDLVKRYYFCSRCGCRMDRNGNPIQVAKQGEFPDFKF